MAIGIYKIFLQCKIYFQVRINQAKRLNNLNITLSLDEKIQLYNMTEEVLWADLDRYVDSKLEIEI